LSLLCRDGSISSESAASISGDPHRPGLKILVWTCADLSRMSHLREKTLDQGKSLLGIQQFHEIQHENDKSLTGVIH
jgi:hypothetical protein